MGVPLLDCEIAVSLVIENHRSGESLHVWNSRLRTFEASRFNHFREVVGLVRHFVGDLKRRIAAAQSRATLSVNRELVALYWQVGRTIVQRQARAGWGEAVVERLAHDLRQAFPDIEGFSPRNIWRMRAFFVAWSATPKKLTQVVSEISVPRTSRPSIGLLLCRSRNRVQVE